MLASAPSLSERAVPTAGDVRAARNIAVELARSAAAETPVPLAVAADDIERAGRVLSNGLPRLRVASAADDEALVIAGAFRIADATWLNGSIRFGEKDDFGYPAISARAGAVPIPALAMDALLAIAHRAAEWRARSSFPKPREAILGFEARPGVAMALVDLPRGLLRGVSKLAPYNDDAVDAGRADSLYVAAMSAFDPRRPVDLADVFAQLFAGSPSGAEAARSHARAAFVAAAMLTVGPRARRLAGGDEPGFAPMLPATLNVTLGGRQDLAKHFALSAAIAAAADPELGQALGTWKELDDSLSGGSGFSFVDLAADRGGLRLGRAANDGERAQAIALYFGGAVPPRLLPMRALGFEEGLGERDFARRYGNIESSGYGAAVNRIDRALDTLPIMRL